MDFDTLLIPLFTIHNIQFKTLCSYTIYKLIQMKFNLTTLYVSNTVDNASMLQYFFSITSVELAP